MLESVSKNEITGNQILSEDTNRSAVLTFVALFFYLGFCATKMDKIFLDDLLSIVLAFCDLDTLSRSVALAPAVFRHVFHFCRIIFVD
jgi:hypothetical protein